MSIIYSIILSITLCIDTFALSVVIGMCNNNIKFLKASKIALIFAFTQSLAPFIGWALGLFIKEIFEKLDHWIAFTILLIIGLKMIFSKEKEEYNCNNILTFKSMLIASIATSFDSFAIGFTISLIDLSILFTIITLGITTYLTAMIGMLIGKKISELVKIKYLEVIGGIALILLGLKILIEHIM
ncbi:MAG: manganese efflux pump MntP family protein [Bacteroidales bacterium]|nr:manganese efflux pump MntP family protein [Bacteroidales bacterium]